MLNPISQIVAALPSELEPYGQRFMHLLDTLLSPEVLFGTTVLTAIAGFVGRISWSGATLLIRWVQNWRLRSVKSHNIELTPAMLPFDHKLISPYCLLVRYGTDQYVEHMASDKEKYDGRLQNKKIKVPMTLNANGSVNFKLRIPIHKRLGTQFKCYFDVADETKVSEVMEFLSGCPTVDQPGVSSSAFHRTRVFFLLRAFAKVETIDELENNMCFPH